MPRRNARHRFPGRHRERVLLRNRSGGTRAPLLPEWSLDWQRQEKDSGRSAALKKAFDAKYFGIGT